MLNNIVCIRYLYSYIFYYKYCFNYGGKCVYLSVLTSICTCNHPLLRYWNLLQTFHSLLILFLPPLGEKTYLCDMCGFAGGTRHALTKHRRQHTGGQRLWHPDVNQLGVRVERDWHSEQLLFISHTLCNGLLSRAHTHTRTRQCDTPLSVIGMCTSVAD